LLSSPQSWATRAFLEGCLPPNDTSEIGRLWLGQNPPVTGLIKYASFQVKHLYLFRHASECLQIWMHDRPYGHISSVPFWQHPLWIEHVSIDICNMTDYEKISMVY